MQCTVEAPVIVWLGEHGKDACPLLGGKACSLSRLASEYRVPPGFCVTAAAWDAFGEEREAAALSSIVADAYARLARIAGTAMPRVAVRSSALDEDGAAASFAGQHETYLNVIGVEAVVRAVMACWESAGSDRAAAYRKQRGLVARQPVAVLVQLMVPADVSAVLFSANPVSGARDEVVINASWGLGESIVGGTVTPDTYTVAKDSRRIVAKRIAEKRRMTVASEEGTAEVDVPRFLRSTPVLTDGTAAEMAALALSLERRMGAPVDVECAVHNGTLYLLQCRPITTLATTN